MNFCFPLCFSFLLLPAQSACHYFPSEKHLFVPCILFKPLSLSSPPDTVRSYRRRRFSVRGWVQPWRSLALALLWCMALRTRGLEAGGPRQHRAEGTGPFVTPAGASQRSRDVRSWGAACYLQGGWINSGRMSQASWMNSKSQKLQ